MTTEERTAEERTAEERTAEERTAEERTAEEWTAEERTAEERTAEERTAEERTAEERTNGVGEGDGGTEVTGEGLETGRGTAGIVARGWAPLGVGGCSGTPLRQGL